MTTKSEHWNEVYGRRAATEVSWFQREAKASLEMIGRTGVAPSSAILDVGAGASTLVDGLLARGYRDITLLDIAESAFVDTRIRLGAAASDAVRYVVSDVTRWTAERRYALWHDRAVFHFLTEAGDRRAYGESLARALAGDGHAVIATFALDGPERCSGLPVRRYSAETLAAEFSDVLRLVEAHHEVHSTPAGGPQSFVFARFIRA